MVREDFSEELYQGVVGSSSSRSANGRLGVLDLGQVWEHLREVKERRLSWERELSGQTGTLCSRIPEWSGAYRKDSWLVFVWENGELDLGWEPGIFSLESPWRRPKLGQKTVALGLKEYFLALDAALAVFDKQGFLLLFEEG